MHIPRSLAGLASALTLAIALPAVGMLAAAPAVAQDRPLTIVVPFAAGGGVDGMARLLAEKLRADFPAGIIIENKGGASGMLGAQYVVRAAPDGNTLLLGSAGETSINPFVYKEKMAYRPERDLVPIALVARVPNVLLASPQLPVNNVAELLAYAKAHPGKLTYATSGVGNPQHLNGELMQSMAGVKMVHVPYKGASQQLVDVASGNVDLTFVSLAGALPFIQGHKVKPLAVTSAGRASFAPDIPALSETPALKDYALENWFGVFAPKGTPAAVQQRLNASIEQALQDPKLVQGLHDLGGEVQLMTAAQFKDFIATQSKVYEKIVKDADIHAE
jgi:tripartite-type tricarboxylate transporter receptor subunit TctC